MASAIKVVDKDAVQHQIRAGLHILIADASDMALQPGEWPPTVAVRKHERWQKDVTLFTRPYPIIRDGAFVGMRYRGPIVNGTSAVLEIMNT